MWFITFERTNLCVGALPSAADSLSQSCMYIVGGFRENFRQQQLMGYAKVELREMRNTKTANVFDRWSLNQWIVIRNGGTSCRCIRLSIAVYFGNATRSADVYYGSL